MGRGPSTAHGHKRARVVVLDQARADAIAAELFTVIHEQHHALLAARKLIGQAVDDVAEVVRAAGVESPLLDELEAIDAALTAGRVTLEAAILTGLIARQAPA